jgi:seryl-tRNA synthetase
MSDNTDVVETEETVEAVEAETEAIEETGTVDLEAEVEKWKALSRKNEQRAKANDEAAKQLEELRKSQLTEQERLIESAKDETRKILRLEFAEKIVDAELKSSLNGRVLDGGALLDFNKSSFVTEDGDVDSDAIQAWVDAHSTKTDLPKPDLGQGARGSKSGLAQIRSREELESMTPKEIMEARKDGRLDALMGKN